jgi:hypothetical protein
LTQSNLQLDHLKDQIKTTQEELDMIVLSTQRNQNKADYNFTEE